MAHPAADGTNLTLELQPAMTFRITVVDADAARAFTETLG